MPTHTISYEQPLNEHIRICLRLEHLFQQIEHYLSSQSSWDSRTALNNLLEVLNVIERPDLKIKLTKALSRHAETLAQLEHVPSIDTSKLRTVLDQLDLLIDHLHSTHGKIGESFRANDFLNNIRQQMANPAGACNFSTPALYLWLQQAPERRLQDIKAWLNGFDMLRNTVNLLLQLTRQGSTSHVLIANKGFYQESLNPQIEYQMIQVTVPIVLETYPEISVGRHRLSIHFYSLKVNESSKQLTRDIDFRLTRCKI